MTATARRLEFLVDVKDSHSGMFKHGFCADDAPSPKTLKPPTNQFPDEAATIGKIAFREILLTPPTTAATSGHVTNMLLRIAWRDAGPYDENSPATGTPFPSRVT